MGQFLKTFCCTLLFAVAVFRPTGGHSLLAQEWTRAAVPESMSYGSAFPVQRELKQVFDTDPTASPAVSQFQTARRTVTPLSPAPRPFDTAGRATIYDDSPLDPAAVDPTSFEEYLPESAPPGRAFYVPSSPGGIVPPISSNQVYEFDSYEGRVPDSFVPPAWFPVPLLWPLSNAQWTWIQGQGNSLGFFEFEKRFMFLNPTQPIRIIPGFMNRYVSGPTTTDLPPDLAEISIEAVGTFQVGDSWTVDAGIRPGLNGDFQYVDHNTFRLQGHVVAAHRVSPDTQLVIGGVYLDREDIPALPVAGVIWQPSSDVKWELVFPRPRVAYRINCDCERPQWVFLKGELGGNSWTIERASGARDVATYRDIRLIVGYEAILANGMSANLEVGWVTARKLMYESNTPDFVPRDTFLLRAGLSF